ncbi:tripartite tricarboxylate transporter substrate binding protein [Pusillimonas sp. SM2304]|uniref:Bug family tripartite tricarboxylate transporter substrate binding protein n=1 Tax=Pusillimonas sp. SM2304 TaxID=3073241 RepID=UPI0028752E8B|nr:tripartite tricarboxylate transporter substrate binding protein [Pusillimonas sp. SM2304]MDS1141024.1 tripartite tricarboxylate transporter substrate binding protein [Pusillimonas sp. SM2304]
MNRRHFIVSGSALAATLLAPALKAQPATPAGAVSLVVGFPAGGGTDVLARLLGQKFNDMWGVPVVVENKAGAAGVIAARHTAKQKNDGTALLVAHVNSHGIGPGLRSDLGYTVEKDFTPIGLIGKTPTILVGGPDQPAKTLKDLVELCKAQPGKVVFGSAGTGSAQHLALEIFKAEAGIDVLHVPYSGSAPLMTDVIGGHVQYAFEGMTTAKPLIEAGKLTALAQTLQNRSKSLPDVPTVAEQGYPGFEASIWFALVGPGGMQKEMVERMNADLNTALATPELIARLEQAGAEDGGGSAERLAQFMLSEQTKFATVIKNAGISVQG